MSRYRKVEVRMWADKRFRGMSRDAQFIWFSLLTGERTLPLPGVVAGRKAVLADDVRMNLESFEEAFEELLSNGMAKVDWDAGLVVLPRALFSAGEPRESAKPQNPNVLVNWIKSLELVAECSLKDEYIRELRRFVKALGNKYESATESILESFDKSSGERSRIQEQDQEQDQEEERGRARARNECLVPVGRSEVERLWSVLNERQAFACVPVTKATPSSESLLLGAIRRDGADVVEHAIRVIARKAKDDPREHKWLDGVKTFHPNVIDNNRNEAIEVPRSAKGTGKRGLSAEEILRVNIPGGAG